MSRSVSDSWFRWDLRVACTFNNKDLNVHAAHLYVRLREPQHQAGLCVYAGLGGGLDKNTCSTLDSP